MALTRCHVRHGIAEETSTINPLYKFDHELVIFHHEFDENDHAIFSEITWFRVTRYVRVSGAGADKRGSN